LKKRLGKIANSQCDSQTDYKKFIPVVLLIGIVIIAIAIRIAYIIQAESIPIFKALAMDSEYFIAIGQEIARGNFAPDDAVYLNPFYPFFLGIIFFLFGNDTMYALVAQGIIDIINCVLIYFIAAMAFDRKAGLIAALLYAFYGLAIFYTGILLGPTLIMFFSLLMVLFFFLAEKIGKRFFFVIPGFIFGLLVLTRPNVILFLVFLMPWFLILKHKEAFQRSARAVLFFCLGLFLVMAASSMRNYVIMKTFSPFSIQGGLNFYIGNNPDATGRFMSAPGVSEAPVEQVKSAIRVAEKELGRPLKPVEASTYWLVKALRFLGSHPVNGFFLYLKKFLLFWSSEELPLNISYAHSKQLLPFFNFPFISFGLLAPFGLMGMLFMRGRGANTYLLLFYVLAYMMSIVIFFVSDRYRLPVVPFLCLFAGAGCMQLYQLSKERNKTPLLVLCGVTLLFYLLVNLNPGKPENEEIAMFHHNNLGHAYARAGRLEDAIIEYRKALSLDPAHAGVNYNMGTTLLKMGRMDAALSYFQKTLKLNPQHADALSNMGYIVMCRGHMHEAIQQFEAALAINPTVFDARMNMGVALMRIGKSEQALAQFRAALELNPSSAKAHVNMGKLFKQTGQASEAIEQYYQALEIDPELSAVHYNLGKSLRDQGFLEKAVEHYRKALAIQPNFIQAHQNIGLVLIKIGQTEEASKHFHKALEIEPNFIPARLMIEHMAHQKNEF
jgi:tetratricopeptide (TPR) repeat protein